jgi:hypothetical protein
MSYTKQFFSNKLQHYLIYDITNSLKKSKYYFSINISFLITEREELSKIPFE